MVGSRKGSQSELETGSTSDRTQHLPSLQPFQDPVLENEIRVRWSSIHLDQDRVVLEIPFQGPEEFPREESVFVKKKNKKKMHGSEAQVLKDELRRRFRDRLTECAQDYTLMIRISVVVGRRRRRRMICWNERKTRKRGVKKHRQPAKENSINQQTFFPLFQLLLQMIPAGSLQQSDPGAKERERERETRT